MTIWKSVQKTASEIEFKVNDKEFPNPKMFVAYSVSGKACIVAGLGKAQGERMMVCDIGTYGNMCDTAIS